MRFSLPGRPVSIRVALQAKRGTVFSCPVDERAFIVCSDREDHEQAGREVMWNLGVVLGVKVHQRPHRGAQVRVARLGYAQACPRVTR